MSFLPTTELAVTLNVSRQSAAAMLSNAAQGKPWRGHHLPVVQLPGQRGGAGGMAWGLDLTRVTPQLLAELPALKARLDKPAAPAVPMVANDHAWRTERARERLVVIRPVLDTAPRTRARGEALRAVEARRHLIKGALERVSLPTLKRWVADFERDGLAGLMPKPTNTMGARRVLITRAWDKEIDLPEDAREAVARELATYAKSLIAKAVSGIRVQSLSSRKLGELMQLRGAILWMDEYAALIARSLATLAKAIEANPDLAADLAGTLNELRQAAEAAIVAMDTIRALLGRAVFIGHDETDKETLQ